MRLTDLISVEHHPNGLRLRVFGQRVHHASAAITIAALAC